jgi:hypothetical protein
LTQLSYFRDKSLISLRRIQSEAFGYIVLIVLSHKHVNR